MKIREFFWTLPFLIFLFGYVFTHSLFSVKEVNVPNVIGKTLLSGISSISKEGLNVKFLKEKEDTNLNEGVILDQIPKGGSKIRPNYPIRIVVSKKPAPKKTPNFMGLSEKEIEQKAKKTSTNVKVFNVSSNCSIGSCIAQSPKPDTPMKNNVIAYVSSGTKPLHIFPNLKEIQASEAEDFLIKNNLRVELFHQNQVGENHFCKKCRVREQKPMAGSIVDLSKGIQVQLLVG